MDLYMSESKTSNTSYEGQEELSEMRLAVALLKQDAIHQVKITDKLAEAVEKIEEMNANLVKMLALHELKHQNTEDDIKELGRRIEHQPHSSTITTTTTTGDEEEAKKTLEQLKKWKYMIIGAALVIGWMLAHMKWSVLVSLFGG